MSRSLANSYWAIEITNPAKTHRGTTVCGRQALQKSLHPCYQKAQAESPTASATPHGGRGGSVLNCVRQTSGNILGEAVQHFRGKQNRKRLSTF